MLVLKLSGIKDIFSLSFWVRINNIKELIQFCQKKQKVQQKKFFLDNNTLT